MTGHVAVYPFEPTSPLRRLAGAARALPVYHCDVLVIGSGVAGLTAALSAADQGAHVMVVCKGRLEDTNTRYAQGGLAAALGVDDSSEFHAGDTLEVGCGLSEPQAVEAITSRASQAVDWLLAAGMRVDRDAHGRIALSREGGHRVARVLHSDGAATGLELQRVLSQKARAHPRVDLYVHTAVVDFLRDPNGRVAGAVALLSRDGTALPVLFEASGVVLATGGGGQIYRETTNPQLATADGVAMALRAGAVLQDLEFIQFHPTILYLAGAARFLISEVTRGAGAVLRDRNGTAFMAESHPDRDLAPRDVVSRSIFRRMIETGDTHVYLDLSAVSEPDKRFPTLARITGEFGIDIRRDPIPVRPAVHYFIGGVLADLDGRTSLEGLWATGECASIGFHGANRMGSNSLLEGLVHGRMVGQAVANSLPLAPRRPLLPPLGSPVSSTAELNLTDMTYSLKSLMWRQVGIERDAAGLEDALQRLTAWESYLARLGPVTGEGVEVVNMVQAAQAVAFSALFRSESRGAHFRSDHPQPSDEWLAHTRLSLHQDGAYFETRPVAARSALSPR